MFTHRLGVEMGDTFAALGPVSGTVAKTIAETATPARPVPVIMFHGTDDAMAPWHGGQALLGEAVAVPDTVDWWVARNQCGRRSKYEWLPNTHPARTTPACGKRPMPPRRQPGR